ncbi:uncharacterized protein LOC112567715 isoform X3 [Pomacea canaliculata]|nr:uncharacterized protein LOC112567715 isoform X3 [Pomacea canaliculata]XP_025100278.1 uncharacterized protein LOC112567715 isoform X3 [Pomacea canaliculata]
MRRANGTVFTCLMIWNGHRRTANYTLQVAYGPDDEHTTIIDPRTVIADGRKSLTLTCRSTDVNPAPVYTWDTDRCEKEDMVIGTCTFTPAPLRDDGRQLQCVAQSQAGGNNKGTATISLNLSYPPTDPPVITGYTPGDVISRGSQLMCNISGGKPMISKVIFTCESLTVQYTNNIQSEVGSVSSSLIIDDINGKNNSVLCTCRGVWEPQEDLYTLTNQILIHTQDNDDVQHNTYAGWIVGLFISFLAGAISLPVFLYLKRKCPSRFIAFNQNVQREETEDHSADPLDDPL